MNDMKGFNPQPGESVLPETHLEKMLQEAHDALFEAAVDKLALVKNSATLDEKLREAWVASELPLSVWLFTILVAAQGAAKYLRHCAEPVEEAE